MFCLMFSLTGMALPRLLEYIVDSFSLYRMT